LTVGITFLACVTIQNTQIVKTYYDTTIILEQCITANCDVMIYAFTHNFVDTNECNYMVEKYYYAAFLKQMSNFNVTSDVNSVLFAGNLTSFHSELDQTIICRYPVYFHFIKNKKKHQNCTVFQNDCGIVVGFDNWSVLNFDAYPLLTIKNRQNDRYKTG
jgi:hypothetical protein